jgi:2,3-dihydroxyphenylpropionate 1,2-dioxygenase
VPVVCGVVATHSPTTIMDFEGFQSMTELVYPGAYSAKLAHGSQVDMQKRRSLYDNIISDSQKMFATLKKRLDEVNPDVLVVVGNDQYVNFFWNLIPQLCIFTGESQDAYIGIDGKNYSWKNDQKLARYILENSLDQGIDLAFSERVKAQHVHTVHLYYLDRDGKYPAIPIFVNAGVPPTITPRRAYHFGRTLDKVLSSREERVAIIGTGGLSHYLAGGFVAGISEDKAGDIDEEGDREILKYIAEGRGEELSNFPFRKFQETGNVEMLNWFVVLGALQGAKTEETTYYKHIMGYGGAFLGR